MTLDKTTGVRLPQPLLEWYQQHAMKRAAVLRRRFTTADAIRIALEEYRERNS